MTTGRLVHGCSGAEAIAALEAAAKQADVRLHDLIHGLHPSPTTFLAQLARAARPQKATIDKLNARLADPRRFAQAAIDARAAEQKAPIVAALSCSREPCFRCGVRGDIGCNCRGSGVVA